MAVNATVGAGSPRPPPIYRPGVAVPDIRIILLHAIIGPYVARSRLVDYLQIIHTPLALRHFW